MRLGTANGAAFFGPITLSFSRHAEAPRGTLRYPDEAADRLAGFQPERLLPEGVYSASHRRGLR
jgi:hypothetical protein